MGQSLWLDNINAGIIASGTLERYIRELSITGLTSNPEHLRSRHRDTGFYDEANSWEDRAAQGAESSSSNSRWKI